jgi:hypothetical protein
MQSSLYLNILITIFGLSCYLVGAYRILKNKYTPNTFSRVVWLILAVNSFAGVYFSKSSQASILLALVLLFGNILICTLSFAQGSSKIGSLEYVCLGLLFISLLIWIFFKSPLINLSISLIAHFIGAAPTYKKLWLNPESEDIPFWTLFFLASVLSVINSGHSSLKFVILPYYYAFFDGSIILLAARRFIRLLA